MHIFYPPIAPPRDGAAVKGRTPYDRQPATAYWSRHRLRLAILSWFAAHAAEPVMRSAAVAEFDRAEDAMAHWARHPNFDVGAARRYAASLTPRYVAEQAARHARMLTAEREIAAREAAMFREERRGAAVAASSLRKRTARDARVHDAHARDVARRHARDAASDPVAAALHGG